MKLMYITCSGVDEHTDIEQLLTLQEMFPRAEFAIHVSGRLCAEGMPRFRWLQRLQERAATIDFPLNFALIINTDWAEDFCAAMFAAELQNMFTWVDKKGYFLFQRTLVNLNIDPQKWPNIALFENAVNVCSNTQFVFPYNARNADFLDTLYLRDNVAFDCLYDEASAQENMLGLYMPGAFPDILQGYAGRLSPANVMTELERISSFYADDSEIFIDAQHSLKDQSGHFSLAKAQNFIEKALLWEASHLKRPS